MNKKKYGQFFTSRPVARFMADWVAEKHPKNILDPAAGEGIFFQVLTKAFLENFREAFREHFRETFQNAFPEITLTSYELDPVMAKRFRQTLSDKSLKKAADEIGFREQVYIADYLKAEPEASYDAIICNPPYHKFQQIPDRDGLRQLFAERYGIVLSGFSNSSSYFLIKSIHELAPGGRCAYIMPYEFLNTGYGEAVKKCLLEKGVLRYIIKFDSKVQVFEDAVTTCCILLLEQPDREFGSVRSDSSESRVDQDQKVYFCEIQSIEQLNWEEIRNNGIGIPMRQLEAQKKWLNYFQRETVPGHKENLIPLGSAAKVSRGIATGNNRFFALSKEMIEKYHLSEEVCLPCVTKAPDIMVPVFREKEFQKLYESNKKVMLFCGEKARTEHDLDYIRYGEEQGADQAYLTKHRNPWYALENRPPAPIWIAVFGRNQIKVVRNEMMVRNLTAFHGIYVDESKYTKEDIDLLFCWLLTPTAQTILKRDKREYGNGLDKFEPGDLMAAYVLDVKKIGTGDRKNLAELYRRLSESDGKISEQLIKDIENIIVKYV